MKKFRVEQVYSTVTAYRGNRPLSKPLKVGDYESTSVYKAVKAASTDTGIAQLLLRATLVQEV